MQIGSRRWQIVLSSALLLGVVGVTSSAFARHGEENILSNRIPEPAPYVVEETTTATPPGAFGAPHTNVPFESLWNSTNDASSCGGCHTGLYDNWNGAMMSNAWRDPGWRGAFLLVARLTSADGDCDIPTPPDNSPRAHINPMGSPTNCSSTYNTVVDNIPTTKTYTNQSGSLMDDFCSRCHMPTNYADATTNVYADNQSPYGGGTSTQEHGRISPLFDPTSCVGTGQAQCAATGTVTTTDPATGQLTPESFATRTYVDGPTPGSTRYVNSNSGKEGIVCEVCHTNVATRYTPYHLYNKTSTSGVADYYPAKANAGRWDDGGGNALQLYEEDMLTPPDTTSGNLGYGVAAGAFRLSPHALNWPERFGPLSRNLPCTIVNAPGFPNPSGLSCANGLVQDPYITGVFKTTMNVDQAAHPPGKHDTFYQVKFERSEFCASCHDVTNPATVKNQYGNWVGGFPIERTYTEWKNSRYADRPGNTNYDPNFKRDCQTCHMQQTYAQPGTALTLYNYATNPPTPVAPLDGPSCDRVTHPVGYTHHFVGGNGYITRLIGADISGSSAAPYPELLYTSFSSADATSRFHYARYDTAGTVTGGTTQHERFAWDRLRKVVTLTQAAPPSAPANSVAGLTITASNDGSGHNFPTGFPEGRAAWINTRAWDTHNSQNTSLWTELMIRDSTKPGTGSQQDTKGVGYLTTTTTTDAVNYNANCPDADDNPGGWKIPEGSIDPWAITFKAMASLGLNPTTGLTCPTLQLPYAQALNLQVDANGVPKDEANVPIDRNNPTGIPQYIDNPSDPTHPNGDRFDDSFLKDTRLKPQPLAGSSISTTRFSVVIPAGTQGPVAVTSIVYYQSFEGIVAKDFLGNLANLDDTNCDEGLTGGSVVCTTATGTGFVANVPPRPFLEPCVVVSIDAMSVLGCDRVGKTGTTGETQLKAQLLRDPVVMEGAPPVPMAVKTSVIQITNTTDNVAPRLVINNCKLPRGVTSTGSVALSNYCTGTNQTSSVQTALLNTKQYPHWSPAPYGGPTGNYASEGYGELSVASTRIVKVSFTEPVQECDYNPAQPNALVNCKPLTSATFYLTDSGGNATTHWNDQIDAKTFGVFPYVAGTDSIFLSGGGYIIHVAPTRNNRAIKDYAGNVLVTGPALGGEYTFGFKAQ